MKRTVSAVLLLSFAIPALGSSPARGAAPVYDARARLATERLPAPIPTDLARIVVDAAKRYGLDPNLLATVAFKESRFDDRAVSRRGAQGIMQLMPRTAKALGVKDSFDARQNVFGGAKYLRELFDRFGGDLELGLAAYNAGPERVAKEGPRATAEATEYVATISKYYARTRFGA